jgi:hypothetical protein
VEKQKKRKQKKRKDKKFVGTHSLQLFHEVGESLEQQQHQQQK